MKITLSHREQRALTIAVIISIVFGAYFLSRYFSVIAIGAILAYVFHPMRQRFLKTTKKPGRATLLTLLTSFLMLIIPLTIIVILTVMQVEALLRSVPKIDVNSIGAFGQDLTNSINNILSNIPGTQPVTATSIASSLEGFARSAAQGFLNFTLNSIGSIPRLITEFILFLFVFTSLLTNGESVVALIKRLNPLGPKITDLYMQKMGDMTRAVIKGQFIIAFVQGLIGATSLYIAGMHSLFFFMLLILSLLSVIPLGSGILTIPIGIVMMLFGNYWQGAFVILVHLLVVTNVDNFLRARLVPKSAHLNSALMMLAVFSGMAMFGFLGIVIGPIIMILIISTIQVYSSTIENHGNAVLKEESPI